MGIPKREHNLHIFGGYTFDESVETEPGMCVLSHTRTVQGSWTAIRDKERDGHQWWVLEAFDAGREFTGDLHSTATSLGQAFARPLPQLIAATDPAHVQRWVIRDRKPLKQWSKAAPLSSATPRTPRSRTRGTAPVWPPRTATSSAAAWPGWTWATTPLSARHSTPSKPPRKPHTARQSQHAYALGQVFHHAPRALQPIRDAILDRTPLMQKVVGDSTPISILTQLGEIDRAEARFTALLGLGEAHDTAS
ncbi:hypothetical protein GCM10010234_67430 [Streptomyces hawaiiensis]